MSVRTQPRPSIAADLEVGRQAARHAAQALIELRADGGRDLGRRGDARAQEVIRHVLEVACPSDAVLSEEAADVVSNRLTADRVWIIDPLDGTREYAENDRHDWAVHVALWAEGELALGVVAIPGLGALVDSETVEPPPTALVGAPRIAVSRTRPPQLVAHLENVLGAALVPMGSAGYKILSVIRGETDAYVHAGGQFEWDSAAPVAIARAAGLHTSRVDGSPLSYNRTDPRLPDLIVCRPDLRGPILNAITTAPALEGRE